MYSVVIAGAERHQIMTQDELPRTLFGMSIVVRGDLPDGVVLLVRPGARPYRRKTDRIPASDVLGYIINVGDGK